MTERWRLLGIAAALNLTLGTAIATAQTVYVRSAPAGTGVEIVMGATPIGSGSADASGDATVQVKLPSNVPDSGTDVQIYVDACEKRSRVLLAERGLEPPNPEAGCERKQVVGFFLMRRVTSLVVDVAAPTVWLRQGPVPAEWLSHEAGAIEAITHRPSPKGLVLYGAGGFVKVRDAVALFCGDAEDCVGHDFRPDVAAGITYWVTRFMGAEVSYVRPRTVTAVGSSTGSAFNSSLQIQLFNVVAKGAVPIGPVRLYGLVGADYHHATSTTKQTIDAVTLTVDDTEQVVPGGTQTAVLHTQGWGLLYGGGFEGWVTSSFGLFGEVDYGRLKGTVINSTEGGIEDRITLLLFGVRLHLGRR
jgi:hypothetical protein